MRSFLPPAPAVCLPLFFIPQSNGLYEILINLLRTLYALGSNIEVVENLSAEVARRKRTKI